MGKCARVWKKTHSKALVTKLIFERKSNKSNKAIQDKKSK